jgi:predicted xylose isomerase-like sugar epimerase
VSNTQLTVVPLVTEKVIQDEAIIAALEKLLDEAKAGGIHHLVVVGVDDRSFATHRIRHRAVNTTLIGALSCTLAEIQREWNSHE